MALRLGSDGGIQMLNSVKQDPRSQGTVYSQNYLPLENIFDNTEGKRIPVSVMYKAKKKKKKI